MTTTISDTTREALLQRLNVLRGGSARKAFPTLILELDNLALSRLPTIERVELMRVLRRPVLGALRALSKTAEQRADSGAEAINLEQRLIQLMCKRLRQTLAELHRDREHREEQHRADWDWVVENLFLFHERQIVYSIESGRPSPSGTWFDLHDLFVQLVILGTVEIGQQMAQEDRFDVEQRSKRLLLLGLLGRLINRRINLDVVLPSLAYWAWESSLRDPHRYIGRDGLIAVEIGVDGPPCRIDGPLRKPFRGWVLEPSPAFDAFLSE